LPLPILATNAVGFEQSLLLAWKDYGAVVVSLQDVSAAAARKLSCELVQTLKSLGKKWGPNLTYGLRTGAGLPCSPVACKIRNLRSYQHVWRSVQEADGRASRAFPLIATFEPLAVTTVQDNFAGLDGHRDNNIVKGAPELFLNQSILLLWPPPSGFYRVGVLSSLVPVTDWVYRNCLLCAATFFSQTESSLVSRGPFDRPPPAHLVGNPLSYMGLAQTSRCSNDALLSFIEKHAPKHLRQALPEPPTAAQACAASQELALYVKGNIGRLIWTEQALARELRKSSPRRALIRALAAGMASATLWRLARGGPVKVAIEVWQAAVQLQDASLIQRWAANSGSHRRKAETVWQQPVGDGRKRVREA